MDSGPDQKAAPDATRLQGVEEMLRPSPACLEEIERLERWQAMGPYLARDLLVGAVHVDSTTARTRLPEFIDQVRVERRPVVICRYGKPVAAIVAVAPSGLSGCVAQPTGGNASADAGVQK